MTVRTLPIAGAIFDCDGVLVDSEQPWLDIMADWLAALGLEEASADSLRGMSAAEAVNALTRAHAEAVAGGTGNAGVRPPSAAQIDAAYGAALADLAAPMPGAPELVAALSGSVPVAVASNGRREDVHGLLERAGIRHLFDAIVTVEDVEHGKPSPDPYLLAAQKLGVEPARAVAFEDSVPGAQAAMAAGCSVVGVNEDPGVPLRTTFRLRSMRQVRFSPQERTLHVDEEMSTPGPAAAGPSSGGTQ